MRGTGPKHLYTEPASAAYLRCQQLVVAAAAQRGQDHAAGRRLHSWAREVGFEVLEVGAYQLHHLRGPQKAFWSWSFLEAGASLLAQKAVAEEELKEMAAGMCAADADPNVLVGHCRNHQLIARKPLSNVGGPST